MKKIAYKIFCLIYKKYITTSIIKSYSIVQNIFRNEWVHMNYVKYISSNIIYTPFFYIEKEDTILNLETSQGICNTNDNIYRGMSVVDSKISSENFILGTIYNVKRYGHKK